MFLSIVVVHQNFSSMKSNRRDFILKSMGLTAGIPLTLHLPQYHEFTTDENPERSAPQNEKVTISVFSKHLQWLDYAEMGQVAAEIGFDGVDITVRAGGHVLPERVTDDLPMAVEAVRKAGLNVFMITTGINNATAPFAENIVATASSLGIRHYRTGYLHYDDTKSIEENLEVIQKQLAGLAALNKKYSIHGEYQNHSGNYFGAAIWDLYTVLKRIKSPWMGSQYDILHATVEGANTWPTGLKLLKPYIKSIDIKDFQWSKKDGKWLAEMVPLGDGLVDLKKYLSLLKQYDIRVPMSLHFEYPLGGAEHGNKTLTIPKEECIAVMKKDLSKLRDLISEAGL
jgi:L-ribulose-5-phosphate 3-epimerase